MIAFLSSYALLGRNSLGCVVVTNQRRLIMMNEHSLMVYEQIKPSLTAREQAVLMAASQSSHFTLESVARLMNVSPHTISGRITSLKKKGLVRVVGRGYNKAGNHCSVYEVSA